MAKRKATAPAALSAEDFASLAFVNDRVICRRCGARKEQHGGAANPHRPYACPGAPKFPGFPKLKDEKKAGELFDRRLAAFWTKRTTSFSPAG